MSNFLELFNTPKPIMGMLHLGRKNTKKEAFVLATQEIDKMINNGINAIIVEDYFGDTVDVEIALKYLQKHRADIIYGVNVLGNEELSFQFAQKYGAKFIQMDSVCGHLHPENDVKFATKLNSLKKQYNDISILGGVRFKYQPLLSERTLEEDLRLGMQRCDGIVVTGEATGQQTNLEKIKEFRNIIGNFPLIIGAGLTPENCMDSMEIADAGIVGSYIKDTHKDRGVVSSEHTREFMDAIQKVRDVSKNTLDRKLCYRNNER